MVLLLAATAHAQPAWDSHSGWSTNAPTFDNADHERRFQEARRDFEETKRKMDEDFKRDSSAMFLPFGAFFVAILIIGGVSASQRKRRRRTEYVPAFEPVIERAAIEAATGNVDVTVLRFGVDATPGKFVSSELERLTKQIEATTEDGRSKLLREIGLTLRRVRAGWIYGAVNEPMRSLGEAKAVFAKHIDDAKLRGESTAGAGIVVITLVVVARGELLTVDGIDAEHLRRALESAAYRDAADIIDIGVVATRCASVEELEAQYPRPHLVPLNAAGVDKAFCKYCGGPFPADLIGCPHCGAPART